MKTLIVTASSKSKSKKDEFSFKKVNKTFAKSLSAENQEQLLIARSNLLNDFKFSQGPDTHHNLKLTNDILYLPAYRRYSGRTFSKVTDEAWDNLNNEKELDCVILSAFYGLVRFNEPIRNYEIKQITKMPSGKAIGKYWKSQGAQEWLFDYIANNEVKDVKFVLSTSYSDIIYKEKLMKRLKEETSITCEDQQFKQSGMKSMLLRGQYINDLLLNNV